MVVRIPEEIIVAFVRLHVVNQAGCPDYGRVLFRTDGTEGMLCQVGFCVLMPPVRVSPLVGVTPLAICLLSCLFEMLFAIAASVIRECGASGPAAGAGGLSRHTTAPGF